MSLYPILFALAAMGVNESMYLIRKRISQETMVCPIGDDCHKVLKSKHSKMFIIPLDIWGFLFYTMIALSCAFAVNSIGPAIFWEFLITLLVLVGSILSLFFTYLQWKVVRAWCFWCLTSAFTVWIMGIIIVLNKVI